MQIVNFDKLDYCSSLSNLNEIKGAPNYKFIKGNLLSADLIKYILEQEQIDTIIHAAAQTHVDNSFGNSFAFTENNVMGTHVLIESAKTHGIKRFIHVSTDEVYGSSYDEDPKHVESDALEPTNPYAATKAAAENIVKSYYRSFKLPVIITRAPHRSSRMPLRRAPGLAAWGASICTPNTRAMPCATLCLLWRASAHTTCSACMSCRLVPVRLQAADRA